MEMMEVSEGDRKMDSTEVSSSQSSEIENAAVDRAEQLRTSTPTETAAVSSTVPETVSIGADTTGCGCSDNANENVESEKNKQAIQGKTGKEAGSSSPAPDFKMPTIPLKINKSTIESKTSPMTMSMKRESENGKAELINETETKLNNKEEGLEAKDSSSISNDKNLPSSSTSTNNEHEEQSKSAFAFAMPKSLPMSKHKSFQGADGSPGQKSEETVDPSKTPEPAEADNKLSQEKEKASAPPLAYREPSWSGVPTQEYYLEVLKNGAIVSKVALNDKPYHVFGRLASCDVQMDHPSLSRYHFVLQYRNTGDGDHDPGFYVFDLGSTHGSFMNKQKLNPNAYYRMKVGHMFKLGGSTRLHILQVLRYICMPRPGLVTHNM